jgi:hypothetical protein
MQRAAVVIGFAAACAPPPREVAVEAVVPCEFDGVEVRAEDVSLGCEELWGCDALAQITIANCKSEPIEVRRVMITGLGDHAIGVEPKRPRIEPGETFSFAPKVWRPGYVRIAVESDDGVLASGSFAVWNPRRPEAIAACRACDGKWGLFGLRGYERCNCKAPDAGRACDDGDDCEGICLFERFTEVAPGAYRRVGTCSERLINFGCHEIVPSGASQEPPMTHQVAFIQTCAD